jgi:hypothetical protein
MSILQQGKIMAACFQISPDLTAALLREAEIMRLQSLPGAYDPPGGEEARAYWKQAAIMLNAAAAGQLTDAFQMAYAMVESHNLHCVNLVMKALHEALINREGLHDGR